MINPPPQPNPKPVRIGEAETPEEKRLRLWWEQQELESVNNVEKAAREVIALVTGLLGLLMGMLAVAEDPLPNYLNSDVVKGLSIATIVAFLVALSGSLLVIYPRQWKVHRYQSIHRETIFRELLEYKQRFWLVGAGAFGVGICLLGATLIAILLSLT